MLRHVTGSEALAPPLHFDEVELPIDLDHPVDLLDDPLGFVASQGEGVADLDLTGLE